jgi:diguanylate cyclase (GGDEF)-like protein
MAVTAKVTRPIQRCALTVETQPQDGTSQPHDGTWLCPTAEDRVRLLDMERRLPPVRLLTFGSIGLAMLLALPWLGWWPIPLLAIVIFGVVGTDRNLAKSRQPEYRVMLAWLLSVAVTGYASLRTEGLRGPLAPWFVVPAIALAVRFRLRGVIAGTLLTGAFLGAMAIATSRTQHLHLPSQVWLVGDIALVASSVAYTLALVYSDVQHRGQALIDPLTGMLNRNALDTRVAELAEQARVNGQPIALIMGDLDRFKSINDERGHAMGDAVLKAVGERIRAHLRAYDLAYRLGGEEFLIVLPGSDSAGARIVAERLRRAIERDATTGMPYTMSFGVGSSRIGAFDFKHLLAETDDALYAAKAEGRNCVHVAGTPISPIAASMAWGSASPGGAVGAPIDGAHQHSAIVAD